MLVTTSYQASPEMREQGKRAAQELNAKWVERRQMSLSALMKRYGEQGVLIFTEEKMVYHPDLESSIFFHPSTGYIRVKRMVKGQGDPLMEISGVQPGDSVLDCTAGLGSDSIVFSYAVGPTGSVTALESESIIALLLREGLAHYQAKLAALNDAMRRIQLVNAHHLEYLKSLPDKSVDIVYFDPMFRIPIEESSSISPYRNVANHDPLSEEAVTEAVRVARKKVILKDHRDSPEFARLGFDRNRARYKSSYGVIEP
ncbi:class I SAM-dependent methyltransferase [Gorillibacterium massiliense]|uniref:class I SAM-dependent methyltransferase n=1 Tax=Gorillibacterium massiliense TaxID=1280390 RepID=UPI0004BA7E45|nr:class I SAM-dependent methyltransferase [Gorillibacterium massiliense]